MKPSISLSVLAPVLVAIAVVSQACSQTAELGVKRATRSIPEIATLSADLLLFRPAKTSQPAWYEEHLSASDACGHPFLVVEQPSGLTADIYFDTRCQ